MEKNENTGTLSETERIVQKLEGISSLLAMLGCYLNDCEWPQEQGYPPSLLSSMASGTAIDLSEICLRIMEIHDNKGSEGKMLS